MDAAHWHLVLTHVPVVGVVFALLVLTLALVVGSAAIRRLSLAAVLFVALTALPTYLTGEPAGEVVERLPGVTEQVIDRHGDAATTALVTLELAGALALAGLVFTVRARSVPTWVVTGMLLVTAVSAGVLGWTANLGGQIRHTEIRTGFAVPAGDQEIRDTGGRPAEARGEKDGD